MSMSEVFGGWPNFTEGAAGSLVGVLGAVGVALWTTRREINKDRERSREEAAVAVAGDLIRRLLDLSDHVARIGHLPWTSGSGIDTRHLTAWEARKGEVKREVAATGALLPADLEADLTTLIGLLGAVMIADFDEDDGFPVLIQPGAQTDLDAATTLSSGLVDRLQGFRRDPAAYRKSH